MPSLFVVLFYQKLFVACRLCVIYVGGDNDFNVQAMITPLMWTIWTSLSAVRERPLNLITHSLTCSSTRSFNLDEVLIEKSCRKIQFVVLSNGIAYGPY